MKLSIKTKIITLSVLVIATRAYDATTTYLHTPTLAKESNIVMKYLGWYGAIFLQLLVCFLLVFCVVYYYNNDVTKRYEIQHTKNSTPSSLLNFILSYHSKKNKVTIDKFTFLNKITSAQSLYAIGYIIPRTLITIGLVVGTSTTFLIMSNGYRDFYKSYKVPVILYLLIPILAIVFAYIFYKKEYEYFKKLLSTTTIN